MSQNSKQHVIQSDQPMTQVDMLAAAEQAIATARAALSTTKTTTTSATIRTSLNRASFLIWAVTNEQRDPTAPDVVSPIYLLVEGEHYHVPNDSPTE